MDKALRCIRGHKSFLVTSHKNLEGDALGSELAIAQLLKALGKKVIIVNDDPAPEEYSFMPGINKIKLLRNLKRENNFDCFCLVDCSSEDRCGKVWQLNKTKKAFVLNIDHHISNTYFADVNLVLAGASSCSEIVYRLFKKSKIKFDRVSSNALYTGIMTDTGSFRYNTTSSFTHQAVADLMPFMKIGVSEIYRKIYEDIRISSLKKAAKIISQVKTACNGKLAWVVIPEAALSKKDDFDLPEYILSHIRALKGVQAAVLLRKLPEDRSKVRVNFRSQGKIDVNKIASLFGGGGHKCASGCTLEGGIGRIEQDIIKETSRVVNARNL
ncbi:MAG: bifunctional oligoribonuclease/PAP phosphatase NrnA [Candidatus Omnitrophica bacterium]|jgi:phosphoesterase RecJ-like protein|nr:bifunctional oligoribonuclease/PAP phosphatase NrnA [Candidatus Omnitrophota bacterium]